MIKKITAAVAILVAFPCAVYGSAGVNVTWFNSWNESQPLANVALTGRGYPAPINLDSGGQPTGDFDLLVYEGNNPGGAGAAGGAQYGAHLGRFIGQATLSASGATVSDQTYDPETNITTFTWTTTEPTNSFLHFSNTRRLPTDTTPTGVTKLELMRPGTNFGDLLNPLFTQALEPFSAFRVGPNWTSTYSTSTPVWADRDKPDGLFLLEEGGGAPWEILITMANELEKDLWVSIPTYADDAYLRNLFRVFFYGSDGVNPYTSTQANPVWAPLDSDRKLYFELGNEVWNSAAPYGITTNQIYNDAEYEINNQGDPNNYDYQGTGVDIIQAGRRKFALMTAKVSEICRDIVGGSNMMTRFRPIIAGQSAYSYVGANSLSYLKVVLGGHDWETNWHDGNFPGKFSTTKPLLTPEDGVSVNAFGNIAHPITYWIYGYATAPYVNGADISELLADVELRKADIDKGIQLASDAGVELLAYEGGIEVYTSYNESGIYDVVNNMLSYWYNNGGGMFMYYSLAGNNGSGLIPDLTRQDPNDWPKLRAALNYAEDISSDVDNSGTITTTDALLALRKSLGLDMSATAWQGGSATGDVNCDGIVNTVDALLLLRYCLELADGTGWCE